MKKYKREIIHYIILALVLTIAVFVAHDLSGLIGLEGLLIRTSSILKIFIWALLFLWYLFFIGIVLVILDLILHKLLKI